MDLSHLRHNTSQIMLSDWAIYKVSGKDREAFCQGQLTNDLFDLSEKEGHLTARLNRAGKVQSFFIIGKLKDHLWLICPETLSLSIKEDLENFVIMEEVSFEKLSEKAWVWFNPFLSSTFEVNNYDYVDLNFYGLPARISLNKQEQIDIADETQLESLRILNGWPKWDQEELINKLISETMLSELALSSNKGCFLGQETVTKIQSNRGAAYYPVLFVIESQQQLPKQFKNDFYITTEGSRRKGGEILYKVENYLAGTLFRDFRVIGKTWEIEIADKRLIAKVLSLPFFKNQNRETISLELFHSGVEAFHKNEFNFALDCLTSALKFNPLNAEAYETIGVILGRLEKFGEAIHYMDQLLEVDPDSVMAHTNKSLFLMRQGKIEEAEKEKSLATVKSFSRYGKEAQEKRNQAEEEKKRELERNRREQMFNQVLEIDPDDTIALYGMADIFFQRQEFLKAAGNLERVIVLEKNYSTAYLLLGKTYEALGQKQKAIAIYLQGITLASKRGDMMPANEMQSRLGLLS